MTKYTETQKHELVRQYENGISVSEICSTNNIPLSTFYYWIKQYKEITLVNKTNITPRQVYLLEKRLKRLTAENEIWRKCKCTINSTLSEKLEAIKNLYEEYGVHACCRVLEVKRSTFYHYLLRSPEQTLIQKEDEMLKPLVKQIFEDSKGRIGAKKIRACMITKGHKVSAERIVRLLREMNLICVSTKKHITYNLPPQGRYRRDKLKRQFDQSTPNTVWVSDITQLYINYKVYYLCVIIDLFSRKVIAHHIANNQRTEIVVDTFKSAFKKRNCPTDLLFHSDQGGQYGSYEFRQLLRDKRIEQSFSNPGCPYDNAVAESFFRSLKAEETSTKYYSTLNELRASVAEYIRFFNNKRPHQKFNYLTPNQVEQNYYKNK